MMVLCVWFIFITGWSRPNIRRELLKFQKPKFRRHYKIDDRMMYVILYVVTFDDGLISRKIWNAKWVWKWWHCSNLKMKMNICMVYFWLHKPLLIWQQQSLTSKMGEYLGEEWYKWNVGGGRRKNEEWRKSIQKRSHFSFNFIQLIVAVVDVFHFSFLRFLFFFQFYMCRKSRVVVNEQRRKRAFRLYFQYVIHCSQMHKDSQSDIIIETECGSATLIMFRYFFFFLEKKERKKRENFV